MVPQRAGSMLSALLLAVLLPALPLAAQSGEAPPEAAWEESEETQESPEPANGVLTDEEPEADPAASETAKDKPQPPDRVKEGILSWLRSFQGQTGDVVVLCALGLMVVCVRRRRFQIAAGLLVIAGGIVLVRVMIRLFFGDP